GAKGGDRLNHREQGQGVRNNLIDPLPNYVIFSINSQFKRSLLVDRAASVGWERQLFDVLGFAVLQNSLTWAAAREQGARPTLAVVRGERRSA
ncbi:MAG: hypothetical protein M0Z82_18865, partial [Actinomycetota bacterium]|nr:hypothetical protein [Actinomycetota bacterium]